MPGHLKKMSTTHFDVEFTDAFAHLADDPSRPVVDYACVRRLFFGEYMSEVNLSMPTHQLSLAR